MESRDLVLGNMDLAPTVSGSNNFHDSGLRIFEASYEDSYEREIPPVCILLLDSWNSDDSFHQLPID